MVRRLTAVLLSALLLAPAALGRERESIRTDWAGLGRQVSERSLSGRKVRVRLAGGGEIGSTLFEVTSDALVVRSTRQTKQWNSAGHTARIPRDQVAALRFGSAGHGRLIGALAGLAGGAGIGAAYADNLAVYEGPALIVKPLVAVAFAVTGLVAGYFIGRAVSRPGPEFVLTR